MIHGGWNGFKVMDDIVYIEIQPCMRKVKCYSQPSNIENAPARQFHTASIIDNQMFVFGGGDGKNWLKKPERTDLR